MDVAVQVCAEECSVMIQKDIQTDVLIVGAGPAGLSAAIYTARANRKTVVLKGSKKSALALAKHVENYPGVSSVSGPDLLELMEKQAVEFGAEIVETDALDFSLSYTPKMINTRNGIVMANSVIIATGKGQQKSIVEGEDDFLGKGLSYCATCDGALYKEREVIIYGKGHEALDDVLALDQLGCKVTLMSPVSEEKLDAKLLNDVKSKGVPVISEVKLKKVLGENSVSGVEYLVGDQLQELNASAIFIVDQVPQTSFLKKAGLDFDEEGFLKVDNKGQTNIDGVYGAGDITGGVLQVVTAAAEGTACALNILKELHQYG